MAPKTGPGRLRIVGEKIFVDHSNLPLSNRDLYLFVRRYDLVDHLDAQISTKNTTFLTGATITGIGLVGTLLGPYFLSVFSPSSMFIPGDTPADREFTLTYYGAAGAMVLLGGAVVLVSRGMDDDVTTLAERMRLVEAHNASLQFSPEAGTAP